MLVWDEATLRKLEQLILLADRVRVGVIKGDRRSRKRGSSVEFADYRNYTQGDDLRRLDWNVYARLEKPFLKLLEEEEDLAVHIVVDASASMDWPESIEAENKFRYALQLAGALGYISLAAGDQLTLACISDNNQNTWGPHRGRQNAMPLLRFLDVSEASGDTDLNLSLRQWSYRANRPGLLLLVSDLFSPSGFEEGLNSLLSRGYEVAIIHVLSPDEVTPPIGGDLKLLDIETGADAEITLDASTVGLYQRRLMEWQRNLAAYCGRHGVHYVPVTTDVPWEQLILKTLREHRIVA